MRIGAPSETALRVALQVRFMRLLPTKQRVQHRLAETGTSDVVDAHLAVVAEGLGTFILTGDPDDMSRLNSRFEIY